MFPGLDISSGKNFKNLPLGGSGHSNRPEPLEASRFRFFPFNEQRFSVRESVVIGAESIYSDDMGLQHYLIHYEELFRGTIDGASVYPREVVKLVLQHNAAAVIFAHPHPSGVSEPSQADRRITERLKQALALIDVRVLDHIVVGKTATSFAEHGWL